MPLWTSISQTLNTIGFSISSYLGRLIKSEPTPPERTVAFTIGMIALGAKMAKADGVVTRDEAEAFKQVFEVPEDSAAQVARLFDLAKQDIAGYETYAQQMADLFGPRAELLEDVLDGLFHIAKADGVIHEGELSYLARVSEIFGFDAEEFRRIQARHVVMGGADTAEAYRILGVAVAAPLETVKKRYHELVRQNHPDHRIAQGVPEEMVTVATDRLARINAAYDLVMAERGG